MKINIGHSYLHFFSVMGIQCIQIIMDIPLKTVQIFKNLFPLLLSEELLIRATLYYYGKENFIGSCI